jgi:hypothetical protein
MRPHNLSDGVTLFDVECAPLERCMTWLIVSRPDRTGPPMRLTVVLPRRIARAAARSSLGVAISYVLPDSAMFLIDPLADQSDVESLVLAGYGAAMS